MDPDDCGVVVMVSTTLVLALPAGTLGGTNEALASGGSPEVENVTPLFRVPLRATSVRL
jgi:hypothetical protein